MDWLKSSHGTKVHSLVDKIYHPENLREAWKKVKANRGSGGIDGESLEDFEEELEANLQRLHEELRDKTYRPAPVREHLIPKAGKPGKDRKLGIPTVYDRVCQQAIKNRLEPIFEEAFDDASFGYRPRRSAWDAVDKVKKSFRSASTNHSRPSLISFVTLSTASQADLFGRYPKLASSNASSKIGSSRFLIACWHTRS